jgi:hypothetical protein
MKNVLLALFVLFALPSFAIVETNLAEFERMAKRHEVAYVKIFQDHKVVFAYLTDKGIAASGIKEGPQYYFSIQAVDSFKKSLEKINNTLIDKKQSSVLVLMESSMPLTDKAAIEAAKTGKTSISSHDSGTSENTNSELGAILLILGGLVFYFIPTIAGLSKRNSGSIFALNFFLGWTFIGWVVALVWAVSKDAPAQKTVVVKDPIKPDVVDQLSRLKKLLDEGVLTQEEFDQQKKKLL